MLKNKTFLVQIYSRTSSGRLKIKLWKVWISGKFEFQTSTVNVRKRDVPFGKPNTFVLGLKSFGSFGLKG